MCKTLWSFALQYYRLAELVTEGQQQVNTNCSLKEKAMKIMQSYS